MKKSFFSIHINNEWSLLEGGQRNLQKIIKHILSMNSPAQLTQITQKDYIAY